MNRHALAVSLLVLLLGCGEPPCPGGRCAGEIWRPGPGQSWQWQLTGAIDLGVEAGMFDVDLFETTAETIQALHDRGRIVICYLSAGSWEDWRDDAANFPTAALGNTLDGWPDERWLDTRDATVRALLRARLDVAVGKGCDGVEPDNVDGYANDSGFPLTAETQLDFNRFLADEAHARMLSVGLKNDLDQIAALLDRFDWALDEECFSFGECGRLSPFIGAGKAAFHAEYVTADRLEEVCAVTRPLQLSTLIKNLDLDAWRLPCP